MNRKSIGFILIIGLGFMASILFTREDNHYKYIPGQEDISKILEMQSINQVIASSGQIIDEDIESIDEDTEVTDLEEVIENNIDKDVEEIVHIDNDLKEKIIIAEDSKKDISRGDSLKDNRNDQVAIIPEFNKHVLDVIETYPLGDKKYPYLLNNDFKNYNGVTEDLYYKGEILLKGNSNGDRASNCTGITFEVFFKAMQRKNKDLGLPIDDINGMSKEQLMDFVLTWFVAKGDKVNSNLAVAIEKYGLGKRIYNLEELRSGDFMDISRENNTGHAVIFMNWIRKDEKIVGFKYWSSQGSTKGISYKEEYFNIKDKNGKKYGNVIIDNLHLARVN